MNNSERPKMSLREILKASTYPVLGALGMGAFGYFMAPALTAANTLPQCIAFASLAGALGFVTGATKRVASHRLQHNMEAVMFTAGEPRQVPATTRSPNCDHRPV